MGDTVAMIAIAQGEARLWRERAEKAEAENAELKAAREARHCFRRDGTPKNRFDSAEAARATCLPGAQEKTYECVACKKWHLGKPPYQEVQAENAALRAKIARVEALFDVEDDRLSDALEAAFDAGWLSKDDGSSRSCRVADAVINAAERTIRAALADESTP